MILNLKLKSKLIYYGDNLFKYVKHQNNNKLYSYQYE